MGSRRRFYGIVVLAACGSSAPPASTRLGPALIAAIEASDQVRAPWRCAAPAGPSLADETLAGWKLSAHAMTRDADGTLSIGVIADAGGAAPATLAALGRVRAKLDDVDLVLALGGMGTTRAELEATLGALADRAKFAVVALPGDLESASELSAAIAALRTKGMYVIDGRLVQRIEIGTTLIALVAGAGDARRLAAGNEGCAYRDEDVDAAFADLTANKGLRILASAEAPRVVIAEAGAREAGGELALTPGAAQELDIALHGPLEAAATPGRSGGRDGRAVPLSPGTSDATTRLPGPRRSTNAGKLTITGTAWKWSVIADID